MFKYYVIFWKTMHLLDSKHNPYVIIWIIRNIKLSLNSEFQNITKQKAITTSVTVKNLVWRFFTLNKYLWLCLHQMLWSTNSENNIKLTLNFWGQIILFCVLLNIIGDVHVYFSMILKHWMFKCHLVEHWFLKVLEICQSYLKEILYRY